MHRNDYRKFFQHLQTLFLDFLWRWTLLLQPKFMTSTMIFLSQQEKLLPTECRFDYAIAFGLNVGSSTEKFVETLLDKTHHICHNENVKFHLKHSLKGKNFHGVVEFQQSKWLGPYIAKSTTMRKQACIDFEKKNFNKLMSNACFGKTTEKFRRRVNMQFVTTGAQPENSA